MSSNSAGENFLNASSAPGLDDLVAAFCGIPLDKNG
jgi:hypothetical protein